MCAFSRTYLSKPKHVWKKAPRCKYTNVFGFFPNMLGKSQTLNLFFFFKFSTMCFHLIKVAECQPFYIYFLGFPLSILFMIPCFQKTFPRKQRFVFFEMFTSCSHPFQRKSFCQISQLKEARSSLIMLLRVAFSSLKPEGGSLLRGP